MKLLLVHNRYLHPGGEDEVFAAEGALLRRQGHEVVQYIEENRRIRRFEKWEVAARTLWSYSAQRRLRPILLKHKPHVAHFHNTFPLISPAAYYTCRAAGIPVVQTLHNYRLLCLGSNLCRAGRSCELCLGRRVPWRGVLHRCYHRSVMHSAVVASMLGLHRWLGTWTHQVDLFVALSEFAREKFIQGGLPGHKVVVKSNFVEPDPGVGSGAGGYAMFAGRLSSEKGVETLLRAWRRLPHIPLLVAGDGPLLGLASRLAASMADAGAVRVLGRCSRAKLFALMKAARFLVFPSQCYENFPLVIAEAFACGIPVIAAGLGAATEIVEQGRTGLLVAPGEATNLAEAADALWSSPSTCRRMGREARAEYEAKYSAQRNYSRLQEIYEMVRRPA